MVGHLHGNGHGHGALADDTLYYLRLAPYLSAISDEQIERLRPEVLEVHYEAGETIFWEGGPAPGLCLARTGRVRIFRTSADGSQEQTLRIIRPGEPFNDVPLFDGGPNPTGAQAIEPTDLLILPPDSIFQLMQEQPGVAIAVSKVLAQRIRQLSGMVDDLLFD